MPDTLTILGFLAGGLILSIAFGWLVGRIIRFGQRDPVDELESRRRRRAQSNGIGRVGREVS